MKRRFSEEQIIGILKEAQASGVKATCAKHNISDATFYKWRAKYGGMDVNEARRLRSLEDENGRLKRAVADLLPESFVHRRKMGFSPPLTVWFRNELRSFVEDTLSESATREAGVFRYPAVRRLLDDHFTRRANYDNQIWALITFMLWQRECLRA